MLRPFANLKPHVFIETFCKRILFIYRQIENGIFFYSVSEQFFAVSFPSFFVREKQHFKAPFYDAHKAHRNLIFVFYHNEMRNFTQCLKDVFLEPLNFIL